MSGNAQWRAHDWFRKEIGHDALRTELRRAIALRDARRQAVGGAEAELTRMQAIESEARAILATFAPLDAERDAARVKAIRSGRPAVDAPSIAERLAAREHAREHHGDVTRAVNAVRAEAGSALLALGETQDAVEALSAALVASAIERFADKLEDIEKTAAALRAIVSATAGTYVAQGFAQPFALPVSERTKTLLGSAPVNARPRVDVPAFRIEDAKTRAAFVAHAAALLADADAPLATTLEF